MKKICLLVATSLILSLSACSDDGIKASDKAISCANAAVRIAEQYLDHDIDYSEASEKMNELYADMEYVDSMSREDENYLADFFISSDIFCLSSSITTDNYKNSPESYDGVRENIETLKESIKEYD